MMKYNLEKIYKIEDELNLFDKKLHGIFFRELNRFSVISKLIRYKETFKMTTFKKIPKLNLIKAAIKGIYNFPKIDSNTQILVVKSPRKIFVGNNYIDIYTDYLIRYIQNKFKIIIWDIQYLMASSFNYDYTLDGVLVAANTIKNFIKINLTKQEENLIKEIEQKIMKQYKLQINLKDYLVDNTKKFMAYKKIFKKILQNKKVKIIISVNKNELYNQALFDVAKEKGILTIELQHGVISKYHRGYYTLTPVNLHYNPKYIFTWGEYWNQFIKIKNTVTIPIGFAHFDAQKEKMKNRQNQKNIIAINQPIFGKLFFEQIIKLAKMMPNYNIFFKIHPSEGRKIYESDLIQLGLNNIKIIGENYNIYDLFSISATQIGVCSTALYEGLSYGLKTIIIDLPCSEYFDDLVEKGIVFKANRVEEIKKRIEEQSSLSIFKKEMFFKEGALINFEKEISRLIEISEDF